MSFPARSNKDAASFARLVRVMSLLEENLKKNYIATRRDVYYQDVELFQAQKNVDALIALLARSLDVTGDELGAVASQKGLFHGDAKLIMNDGTERSFATETEDSCPVLIPRLTNVKEVLPQSRIDYILVVEKEAVFNALIQRQEDGAHGLKRIIITAKGYPDVLTRTFLHMLTQSVPQVPVFGFSDFDPYGLQILRQFKTGGSQGPKQGCAHLQLTDASIVNFFHRSCCLPLALRDFLACRSNLCRWPAGELAGNWGRETQRMMFFGRKAELDGLRGGPEQQQEQQEQQEQLEIVAFVGRLCRGRSV